MASKIKLLPVQEKAVKELAPGKVLCGGVGSGKTITSLTYYHDNFGDMPLLVITTPKKRDEHDWEDEAKKMGLKLDMRVDSWSRVQNYVTLKDHFVIFDEQRIVGYGSWSKSFLKITKNNPWIILSATPGDRWMDYMTIFVANGFYRNKTDFVTKHVEYDRFSKFPKIKSYHNEDILESHRKSLLVRMPMKRRTIRHDHFILTEYDKEQYKLVTKMRVNTYTDAPIRNGSEYVQVVRKITSTDPDRIEKFKDYASKIPKLIVFYNFDYERDILIEACKDIKRPFSEWSGHQHDPIPTGINWVYIVQYTSGAEGWNCITTDSILFYSPNYSYKIMEQSKGRIDRMNTQFTDLHYYWLLSKAKIDTAIVGAVKKKKRFNERAWLKEVRLF